MKTPSLRDQESAIYDQIWSLGESYRILDGKINDADRKWEIERLRAAARTIRNIRLQMKRA